MSSWTDKRPMSPHLWQWRWHITMLGSILHRMTGMANYVGAALIVTWLFAIAVGPNAYDRLAEIIATIPVQVILFGFTLSVVYHTLNGVRHFFWDVGTGFNPKFASLTGSIVLLLSIAGAVAIWVLAGLIPGIDPLGMAAQ